MRLVLTLSMLLACGNSTSNPPTHGEGAAGAAGDAGAPGAAGGHAGTAGTSPSGGAPSGVCVPGAHLACACPNGSQGTQVCAGDGKSLGACGGCAATQGAGGGAPVCAALDPAKYCVNVCGKFPTSAGCPPLDCGSCSGGMVCSLSPMATYGACCAPLPCAGDNGQQVRCGSVPTCGTNVECGTCKYGTCQTNTCTCQREPSSDKLCTGSPPSAYVCGMMTPPPGCTSTASPQRFCCP